MTGTAALSSIAPVAYVALDGNAALVAALNLADGSSVWSTPLSADASSSVLLYPCNASSANASDCIAVCAGSSVVALEGATGRIVWSTDVGSTMFATPTFFNPPTSPCATLGCLYIGTGNGSVLALAAATGVLVWQFESYWDITATAVATAAVSGHQNGVIYVGNGGGSLFALDAATGATVWSFAASAGVAGTPALALRAGVAASLIVGVDDGNLYSIDAATGAQQWTSLQDGAMLGSPAVDALGNAVIVVASFLCGINGTNGNVMWCFDAPSQILSSPAIGDDGVVYGSSAGAFEGNNAVFALRAC